MSTSGKYDGDSEKGLPPGEQRHEAQVVAEQVQIPRSGLFGKASRLLGRWRTNLYLTILSS
jgi:hypothetical protein